MGHKTNTHHHLSMILGSSLVEKQEDIFGVGLSSYNTSQFNVHLDKTPCEWMDGWDWMDGWMDGWMDAWIDGWMDAWMDEWCSG